MVLLKDKRKVFALDKLAYQPEVGAVHPGGGTVAVGGAVRNRRVLFMICMFHISFYILLSFQLRIKQRGLMERIIYRKHIESIKKLCVCVCLGWKGVSLLSSREHLDG